MSNRKNRLLPFSWTPAAWGLHGPAREEAEAAYYYEGYDLDLKLAEIRNRDDDKALALAVARAEHKHKKINEHEYARQVAYIENREDEAARKLACARVDHRFGNISHYELEIVRIDNDPALRKDEVARAKAILTAKFDNGLIDAHTCDTEWAKLDYEGGDELALALLEVDLRHGKITPYEHDTAALKIEYPEEGTDRELARLDVEFKHDKMGELAYHKARATLLEEPWVGIVDQGFDATKGLDGVYFEFDWNEYWIVFLRLNGYYGRNDEEVVDAWFADVCRSQGMAAQIPDASVIPFNGGRGIMNRIPDE